MFFLHCPKSQYTRLRETGGNTHAKKIRTPRKTGRNTHTPRKTGRNTIASLRVMGKPSAIRTPRETGRDTRVMGKPSAIRTPRETGRDTRVMGKPSAIRTPRENREENIPHAKENMSLCFTPTCKRVTFSYIYNFFSVYWGGTIGIYGGL